MRSEPFGGGLVDLLVLSVARRGETYGYEATKALTELGVEGLSEATVYACLRRLEERGFLVSRQELAANGKARRYYSLTADGEAHRAQEQEAWVTTRDAVARVLAAGAGGA